MKNENKSFPTFQEQYNKIVGAYMRNELNPYISCGCFVGNLLNNTDKWNFGRQTLGEVTHNFTGYKKSALSIFKESNGFYTVEEIIALEALFLAPIRIGKRGEESLFTAMETTLIALRRLHELKGETVSDYQFTKRLSPSF